MKPTLAPGLTGTRRVEIDGRRTVDFLGDALRVYATPELVRDIETSCRDLLLLACDEREDSVGTGIRITHAGATLLGMTVAITATVRSVEGRKVTFEVVARDDVEEVGRGEHSRFIVDLDKLRSRVAAKAAKAA
jgi:predicted thioesterase